MRKKHPPIVSGTIEIQGVAIHPAFRKWQLDLLINGEEATFLALGQDPQPELGPLTELDTALYPDGTHTLRLRVVHNNLNYDEYFLALTFANHQEEAQAQGTVTIPTPTPSPPPEPPPPPPVNGFSLSENIKLRGTVDLYGVAAHPTFRKWQIDLLIHGDQTQATFIDLGKEEAPTETLLTSFDTTRYPNGQHVLRLRVVHSNMNYDEYITPVFIDNGVGTGGQYLGGGINRYEHGPAAYIGDSPVVYLTFDDGPLLPYTQQILDLLAEYDARATFFVLGHSAAAHPDLIKAAYEAGHGLGNHSWSHRRLTGLSEETFKQEMLSTAGALDPYGARCMRPPYGATDASTYKYANKLGYAVVLWSIDPWDWKHPGADTIARSVLDNVFPGAIVLLHDGGGDRSQTVAALRTILAELSARGYVFATYCR